jgi:hypothetical protein
MHGGIAMRKAMRKKKKKYSLTAEVLREEHRLLNGQREFFADVEKGIWDKFVEEHKEQIAQAIRDCAAFAAPEQPLGTVAEPAGLSRIRAERKANELREKKSALEAKIMEKLMAE